MTLKYRYPLIAFSLLILAVIIWSANPVQLISLLSQSDLKLLGLAFLISNISIGLRVLKWSVLIRDFGVSYRELFPTQLFGMTLSNFTPGKIGEPIKAIVLKLQKGIDVSKTLPSIIWERIIDVLVLVLLGIVAIQLLSIAQNIFYIGMISMSIFIAVIIILLAIMYSQILGKKIFFLLKKLPIIKRIGNDFIEVFYQGVKIRKHYLLASFIVTLITWILDGFVLYFALLALGVELSPLLLAGVIALSTLIGIVTFLPGGIGSIEISLIVLLGIVGVETSIAVTGIMAFRFLSFWYGSFLGGLSFIYLSKKINIKGILNRI